VVGSNISPEVYLRQEPDVVAGNPKMVMGRSSLMKFLACPHKWLKSVQDDSESLRWGNVIDCALLTPESFQRRFVVAPETYPAAKGEEKPWNFNATYCKGWRSDRESEGFSVIKSSDMAEANAAVKAMEENDFAVELLKSSGKQTMLVGEYHDEATGIVVPLKALLDFEPVKEIVDGFDLKPSPFARYLGDLKTTESAAPRAFEKSIYTYNYDAQAWLSLTLYNAATGERRDGWQFIIQENSAPFETPDRHPAIYEGGEFMQTGEAKVMRALKLYCQCLKTGIWPSYPLGSRMKIGNSAYVANPEPWMLKQIVEGMDEIVIPSEQPKAETNDVIP